MIRDKTSYQSVQFNESQVKLALSGGRERPRLLEVKASRCNLAATEADLIIKIEAHVSIQRSKFTNVSFMTLRVLGLVLTT